MASRAEIVAEARMWIGTPYHHMGRVMGHGVDCYGVIEMVGRAMGVTIPEGISYSRIPDEEELIRNMDTYAVNIQVSEARMGDIILLPWLRKIRHMAIITDKGMLHAYEPEGRVVEHSMSDAWKRRIRRAYQYPGVLD